ncbi:MAG: hypothetical protein IPL33_16855 [Sphingobacteriales bacterium]|nr:hypothetical protein [Sphingobacteriales bacterium]
MGIISLVVWGCGGWFGAKRQDKQQERAEADSTKQPTATTTPIFSAEIPQDANAAATSRAILPTDTPSILRFDSPIREKCQVGGRYHDIWRLVGGPKTPMPPDVFMEQYLLPYVNTDINELRFWRKNERDKDGYEQWYYQQYHKGLPTTHSLTLRVKNGMTMGFDTSFDEAVNIDTVPTISEQQAIDSVKAFLAITDSKSNPLKYWGILDQYSGNDFPYPQANIDQLQFTIKKHIGYRSGPDRKGFRVGNHLIYYLKAIGGGPTLTVDPFTGKVVGYYLRSHACTNLGSVNTMYGLSPTSSYGNQSFCIENGATIGNYVLQDNSRMPTIATLLATGNTYSNGCYNGIDIAHNSLDWNTHAHREYATAHWAIQEGHDYFSTIYNYAPLDPIELILDSPESAPQTGSKICPNANSPTNHVYQINIGQDVFAETNFFTSTPYNAANANSLSVIGHEYAHGIGFYFPANPPVDIHSNDVSATATESFCDILGACFEYNISGTFSWVAHQNLCDISRFKPSFIDPHMAGMIWNGDINDFSSRQPAFITEKILL